MKKAFAAIISAFVVLGSIISVCASGSVVPYTNYTYAEAGGSIVEAPQAYLPKTVIYGSSLGIDNFNIPTDIDVDKNGDIYILDEGNNRVVIVSEDFKLKQVITCDMADEKGETLKLNDAKGITVTDAYIYICDTENSRILVLDKLTGGYVKSYRLKASGILDEKFIFKPTKVAVDREGNLYVVSNGTYEGLLNIKENGEFLGFFASNDVSATPWELFWRKFSTREQRKKSEQLIPQDFSSVDMDSQGFFFITTYTEVSDSMVKRMNPGGNDVIRKLSSVKLIGDPIAYSQGIAGKSSFSDVAAGPYKLYCCLDKTRGKVFCYNYDGYLLYTFGTLSSQDGGFSNPVAITYLNNDCVAVLDDIRGSLTVFAPTAYADEIHKGIECQNNLDYEGAYTHWNKVLEYNSNYDLALNMLGSSYQGSGEYDKAMEYFKGANNKKRYSETKALKRSETIYEYQWVLAVVIVLILVAAVISLVKKVIYIYKNRFVYDSEEE